MISVAMYVTEIGGPRAKKAELTRAINSGLKVSVERDYHEQFLPQHFKSSAPKKYGYSKRTKKYMIRKARVKHHQNPLMWSGALKREVTSNIEIRATKTMPKVSGKMRGRALRFSGRDTMPNMKAEILFTTGTEIQRMGTTVRRIAAKHLNSIQKHETRKIT